MSDGHAVRSLAALVEQAAPGDALARAIEAILRSGLQVIIRDGSGRALDADHAFDALVGPPPHPGDARETRAPRIRLLDHLGRELAGREDPAETVRTTGNAVRERLIRVQRPQGRGTWVRMSVIPLERRPEGWATVTLMHDVSDLVERIDDLRREQGITGALLRLSLRLGRHRWSTEDAAPVVGDVLVDQLPPCGIAIVERGDTAFRVVPGTFDAEPWHAPAVAGALARWDVGLTYATTEVAPGDLFADALVPPRRRPAGSLVLAPTTGLHPRPPAALLVDAPARYAFEPWQIVLVEQMAEVVGPALSLPGAATARLGDDHAA